MEAGLILFFGLVIFGIVRWEMYKYSECLKVGHSKMYCILSVNSK